MNSWIVIVPARLKSQRLTEKPLADLGGKPLVVRVCDNLTALSKAGHEVIVATDSSKIRDVCQTFGQQAIMTSTEHSSGTDRIWEVAQATQHTHILNVQGDEPLIRSQDLLEFMAAFETADTPMGTLVCSSSDKTAFENPNNVKVVIGSNGNALYFSRAGVPFTQGGEKTFQFWQHIGIYAFTRKALQTFCSTPRSSLEQRESLEQLRALELGLDIVCVPTRSSTLGVDTPEDLAKVREHFTSV